MRIIDLLNERFNEGDLPKKIKYHTRVYEYDAPQDDYGYFMVDHYEYLLDNINTFSQLDDEVEIIEDKPYMGLMTKNVVANTTKQEVKFDLCLMFGDEYKIYEIDTYNRIVCAKTKD